MANARWIVTLGLKTLLGGVLLATGTGCTVAGHWAGGDLKPEMARDQWDLFRPAGQPGNFVEADLRLQQDGSYTATVNYDGQLVNSMGRWEQTGDKLTFIENDGKSIVFFTRQPHAEALQVVKGIKGTDVVLTLKKQHD